MDVTDEQVRLIIRIAKKHLGKNATPKTMKYVVMKVVQKFHNENNALQIPPKHT